MKFPLNENKLVCFMSRRGYSSVLMKFAMRIEI